MNPIRSPYTEERIRQISFNIAELLESSKQTNSKIISQNSINLELEFLEKVLNPVEIYKKESLEKRIKILKFIKNLL